MRAVVYDRYGAPDGLRLVELPVPAPAPRHVLVRVAAVSLNLSDWECLRGRPLHARLGGLRRPARSTLGSDIAGWVEAVGDEVTEFAPGDEVYGDNLRLKGGFADYATAPASVLAHKPSGLSFVEASTIPQAGAIALAGIVGQPSVGVGKRVLVNGGGGGSGGFAIQLARRAGAHVTGVDNAEKLDFMRSVGADDVVDYTRRDFASRRGGERYDHVLDLVASRSMFSSQAVLAPGGRYWGVGGSVSALVQLALLGPILGRLTHRHLGLLMVRSGPAHFAPLAELCATGEVQVHIDRMFPLDHVADALCYLGDGHARGKVVVTVDPSPQT